MGSSTDLLHIVRERHSREGLLLLMAADRRGPHPTRTSSTIELVGAG